MYTISWVNYGYIDNCAHLDQIKNHTPISLSCIQHAPSLWFTDLAPNRRPVFKQIHLRSIGPIFHALPEVFVKISIKLLYIIIVKHPIVPFSLHPFLIFPCAHKAFVLNCVKAFWDLYLVKISVTCLLILRVTLRIQS